MKFQVFGCPSCQQPFQVAETQVGQLVQCPSCAQTVEIQANAFAEIEQHPAEQRVYACPNCTGQFGVTPDMFGQHVGCPHCKTNILVQAPDAPQQSAVAPEINTDVSPSKQRKDVSKRWKSPVNPDGQKDLFAPGFEQPKRGTDPQTQPVRRTEEPKSVSADLKPPSQSNPSSDKRAAAELHPPNQKSPPKKTSNKRSEDVSPPRKRDVVPPPSTPEPKSLAVATPAKKADAEIVSSTVAEDQVNGRSPEAELDSETKQPDEINQPDSIGHLLPPRFDVLDPTRMRLSTGKDQFKVFLPDGKGGTQQVDQRLVRVEHEGEQVSLVAMTEKEKRRRRLIQNIVAIVIGIIIMAIAFQLLR
jgi:DNA-directed RNA polymerase subunit RPC12/RpoP